MGDPNRGSDSSIGVRHGSLTTPWAALPGGTTGPSSLGSPVVEGSLPDVMVFGAIDPLTGDYRTPAQGLVQARPAPPEWTLAETRPTRPRGLLNRRRLTRAA